VNVQLFIRFTQFTLLDLDSFKCYLALNSKGLPPSSFTIVLLLRLLLNNSTMSDEQTTLTMMTLGFRLCIH